MWINPTDAVIFQINVSAAKPTAAPTARPTAVPTARPTATPAPTAPSFKVDIINSTVSASTNTRAAIQITPYSTQLSIETPIAGLRVYGYNNGRFEFYNGVPGRTYPVNIYYYSQTYPRQKTLISTFNITVVK